MDEAMHQPPRKGLRIGHISERGGINAVRTLLERNGMVVDEVEGRSDYGRDLNVDVTENSSITGGIFGVQVKGGKTYVHNGRGVITASPTDWEYWRASTVPIIGMVWDPATDVIRWRNLTQLARSRVIIDDNSYDASPQSDEQREVVLTEVVSDQNFTAFIEQISSYLRATDTSAYLQLIDEDDEVRREGIFNCWTLGRRDPRSLVLLRHVLTNLTGRSLMDGITVLAHATSHPDIFWTPRNWISPAVEQRVQRSFRWTPDELVTLIDKVENFDPDYVGWERGGIGQSLWSIMIVDPDLHQKLPRAIAEAVAKDKIGAAFRLLVCYQSLAEDPLEEVVDLLHAYPALRDHEMVSVLLEMLKEHGYVPVY